MHLRQREMSSSACAGLLIWLDHSGYGVTRRWAETRISDTRGSRRRAKSGVGMMHEIARKSKLFSMPLSEAYSMPRHDMPTWEDLSCKEFASILCLRNGYKSIRRWVRLSPAYTALCQSSKVRTGTDPLSPVRAQKTSGLADGPSWEATSQLAS